MNKSVAAPAATGSAAAPAAAKAAGGARAAGGAPGYTMEEVAKHTTKGDCWVVLHGRVLNVSNFLPTHPGGELAILTFAGKDASAEFDMIHPPDVVQKYAPDAIIGMLGGASNNAAPAAAAEPASTGATAAAEPLLGHGERVKSYALMDKNRKYRMEREGLISGWS